MSPFHTRDAQGDTPFMAAVSGRAYPAALTLFDTITQLATGQRPVESQATGESTAARAEFDDKLFKKTIYPPGSEPDASPLYVMCFNDTCSFTWTGTEHTKQVS